MAGKIGVNLAIAVDRDALGVGRDGNAGGDRIAIGGHDLAINRAFQRTVARIGHIARGQRHLDVTLAVDRQIQIAASLAEHALRQDHRHR